MTKKYTALRSIATIYKILGVLVFLLTLLAMLGICLSGVLASSATSELEELGVFGALVAAGFTFLYGGLVALGLYGAGEAILVFLAIEENTRATSMLLQSRFKTKTE